MLAKCEPQGKPEHAINAKRTKSLLRDIITLQGKKPATVRLTAYGTRVPASPWKLYTDP